ncbi:GNAT family N-acetyltransferase [Paenibacillus sp. FSL R7-0652]|uniref:GNAT family N-acetyltransferase n=1 Tax=Paenibacillus sp. AN1007 TaxID=3151385 RepID=A0AAU8NJF8_9BACL
MVPTGTRLISVQDSAQREILSNLAALYLHDLSAYTRELEPNDQGLFEYEGLHLYEEDERLHAFLIMHDSRIAGFVLLNEPPYTSEDVNYCVNELFILNPFRNKGIGQAAVRLVFEQFPGKYLVFQLAENQRAISFWRKVYEKYSIHHTEVEELYDGDLCVFQRFAIGKT